MILWDVKSRRQVGQPIPGFEQVAFSNKGNAFVTAGQDGGIVSCTPRLWSADKRALRDHVCAIVGQTLTPAEEDEFRSPGTRSQVACAR